MTENRPFNDFLNTESVPHSKETNKRIKEALIAGGITVKYITPKIKIYLPIIDITKQPIPQQIETARQFATAAFADQRKLVYEFGNHPLSTGDAAVGLGTNVTVIGFNPEAIELTDVVRGTENIKLPGKGSGSIALNTNLLTEDIKTFPIADQAQAFAPYPSDVRKFTLEGCQHAKETYIVLNPSTISTYPPEDAISNLPKPYRARVVYLTRKEIEKITGTSISKFLDGYEGKVKIPVVVAK